MDELEKEELEGGMGWGDRTRGGELGIMIDSNDIRKVGWSKYFRLAAALGPQDVLCLDHCARYHTKQNIHLICLTQI